MAYVGIDIGTSNTCVAVAADAKDPEVILSPTGGHLTPSVVAYTPKLVLVGDPARQQQASNPLNTFVEFKRVIGRSYAERATWKDAKHWPFMVVKGEHGPSYSAMHCGEMLMLTATDLTTTLCTSVLQTARAKHPEFAGVTVTVPAHFNPSQRKQTKRAVEKAGIKCPIRVLNEPTAAILAYDNLHENQTAVVFDLGAGTLDITAIKIRSDVYDVLASAGEPDLGGVDFDQRLIDLAVAHAKQHGVDLTTPKTQLVKVRAACEQAKRTLSVVPETTILVCDDMPPLEITRTRFEKLIAPEIARCATVAAKVKQQVEEKIDAVILCGGSSRVPAIQQMLRDVFPDSEVRADINVDECVALGAARHAASFHHEIEDSEEEVEDEIDPIVSDIAAGSIGIQVSVDGFLPMVKRGTKLPASARQELFPMCKNQRHVDIRVYQGESDKVDDNTYLGYVRLAGIKPTQPMVHLLVVVTAENTIKIDARDDDGHRVVEKIRL